MRRAAATQADAALADLAPVLALGLTRVPMTRDIGGSDIAAIRHVGQRAAETGARRAARPRRQGRRLCAACARHARAVRVYTPHGGSLHYRWSTPAGLFYLTAEKVLKRRTDLFLFESHYGRDTFAAKIGEPAPALVRVVHNGVAEAEFLPVNAGAGRHRPRLRRRTAHAQGRRRADRGDGAARARGPRVTATIVGDGADRAAFEAAVAAHNLGAAVRFVGAKPARAAFALGRMLVVPSRAESLPYIVLEAAAAGLPIIATNVGGIPEIFGPDAGDLVPPDDPAALAGAIAAAHAGSRRRHSASLRLKSRLRASFSVDAMTDAVIDGYREALARSGMVKESSGFSRCSLSIS